jgi:hypothetical protein
MADSAAHLVDRVFPAVPVREGEIMDVLLLSIGGFDTVYSTLG